MSQDGVERPACPCLSVYTALWRRPATCRTCPGAGGLSCRAVPLGIAPPAWHAEAEAQPRALDHAAQHFKLFVGQVPMEVRP